MPHVDWTAVGTLVLAVLTAVMCVLQFLAGRDYRRDALASAQRVERLIEAQQEVASQLQSDVLNKLSGAYPMNRWESPQ